MLRQHQTARVYILGSNLSASITLQPGWATVVLIDLEATHHIALDNCLGRPTAPIPIGENLSLCWTPERGFNHDPTEWLCRRRSRLSTSPGMTVLALSATLATLVVEHMEELNRQIEEDREKGTPDPDDLDIAGNLEALEELV